METPSIASYLEQVDFYENQKNKTEFQEKIEYSSGYNISDANGIPRIFPPLNFSAEDNVVQSTLYNQFQVIIVSVLAAAVSVCTVVGNIMVIVAFVKESKLRSPNNYYLLCLSIADLCVGLFSMPLYTMYELMGTWPSELGPIICDIWLAVDYTFCTVSISGILIISIDRYLSLKKPLLYRIKRTSRRALMNMFLVWFGVGTIWFSVIFVFQYKHGTRQVAANQCYPQFLMESVAVTSIANLVSIWVPLIVTFIFYFLIYRMVGTALPSKKYSSDSGTGHGYSIRFSAVNQKSKKMSASESETIFQSESDDAFIKHGYDEDDLVASGSNSSSKSVTDKIENVKSIDSSQCFGYKQTCVGNMRHSETKMSSLENVSSVIQDVTFEEASGHRPGIRRCSEPTIARNYARLPAKIISFALPDNHSNTPRGSVGENTELKADDCVPANSRSMPTTRQQRLPSNALFVTMAFKKGENKALKTLTFILCVFAICWLPWSILVDIKSVCDDCINHYLYAISYWLCYLNSLLNPFCYAAANPLFRRTFRKMCCGNPRRKRRSVIH